MGKVSCCVLLLFTSLPRSLSRSRGENSVLFGRLPFLIETCQETPMMSESYCKDLSEPMASNRKRENFLLYSQLFPLKQESNFNNPLYTKIFIMPLPNIAVKKSHQKYLFIFDL